MADNVELDPGTGGAIVATDDVGGVHYQVAKLAHGGADSATLVSTSSGLPVQVLGTSLVTATGNKNEDAAAASGDAGLPILGVRNDTATDRTSADGDYGMVSLDSAGRVGVTDLGGTISVDDGGGSLTVDGSVSIGAAIPAGTNNIGDVDVLTVPADPFGANADAAATAGSTGSIQAKLRLLTSQLDSVKTAVETLDNAISGSEMQVDVVAALPAGTNNIGDVDVLTLPGSLAGIADDAAFTVGTSVVLPVGYLADQASTDSVNEGDTGAARMTLTRQQIVTMAPSVDTEGATIFRTLDADVTEEEIKATPGKILGWFIYNDGAAEAYVKFYNATAANVTVGTTTPVLTIPIPAGSGSNIDWSGMGGIPFSTAICIAATTVVTDADTTDVAANQVIANVLYV